jgi:hypothetical protein
MTHINYIHCNKTLHQMTEFQEMQDLISVLLVKYPFTTGVAKVHGSTEQDGFDPQSQHPLSKRQWQGVISLEKNLYSLCFVCQFLSLTRTLN